MPLDNSNQLCQICCDLTSIIFDLLLLTSLHSTNKQRFLSYNLQNCLYEGSMRGIVNRVYFLRHNKSIDFLTQDEWRVELYYSGRSIQQPEVKWPTFTSTDPAMIYVEKSWNALHTKELPTKMAVMLNESMCI